MEPLLAQLRALPAKLKALPSAIRWAGLGVLALVVGLAAIRSLNTGGEEYQYAFTNLGPEDGSEASAQLKAAGIPFRLDAGGSALAVPASKVYDTRLLLAASGLPRGGGVGFELFDRGDIGVSEFTQRVNLRRAIEGELARTIGSLSEVRSARVHVSLAERGLYRDEDRRSSASVVLNLRSGRTLGERELAGIRHLVSAAVPGLSSDAVTIVDGRGMVLGDQESWGLASRQRDLERDLEQRIVSLLEPAVGAGAVVARATVQMDATEVDTTSEIFDPDSAVIRSERSLNQSQTQTQPAPGGIAGAAANQPMSPTQQTVTAAGSSSTTEDQTRNYEVSKTVTRTASKSPRLHRLSVAILVDGVEGKPRSDAEVARLGELAKRAVGFDAARGDQLDISSVVFTPSADDAPAPTAPGLPGLGGRPVAPWLAAGAGLLALAVVGAGWMRWRRRRIPVILPPIRPGMTVDELEALDDGESAPILHAPPMPKPAALEDPDLVLREKARELARKDPVRAARLVRAWIANETEAS
ncbi:flagellar basal-body MS-ring/collar protein FliF [Vulgatibacter incomptus]|uniref:Flagellar M-ring protein n=1 Tax=Vulgatibacter incomptus TaxID=1391653 RepID=A0A0K1PHL1_9BACT|nr:flagellar basal-body MS-ring/collar protein FliF [Vulgatibacter incomptus]AKU93028.1 Flagellar M-ring protein FliF [Vulgatibacter incomptus]